MRHNMQLVDDYHGLELYHADNGIWLVLDRKDSRKATQQFGSEADARKAYAAAAKLVKLHRVGIPSLGIWYTQAAGRMVRCELGDALLMRLYDAEDVQHTTQNQLVLAGLGDMRELVMVEQAD